MRPPTPSTSRVAPIRSGATWCTLRAKKVGLSGLPSFCSLTVRFWVIQAGMLRPKAGQGERLRFSVHRISYRAPYTRILHGRRRRYRFSHAVAPASPGKGEPAGCALAAEAGLDSGAG